MTCESPDQFLKEPTYRSARYHVAAAPAIEYAAASRSAKKHGRWMRAPVRKPLPGQPSQTCEPVKVRRVSFDPEAETERLTASRARAPCKGLCWMREQYACDFFAEVRVIHKCHVYEKRGPLAAGWYIDVHAPSA